jgi:hypothetical protein
MCLSLCHRCTVSFLDLNRYLSKAVSYSVHMSYHILLSHSGCLDIIFLQACVDAMHSSARLLVHPTNMTALLG